MVVCGWLVAVLGLLSVIQAGQVYTNYQVIRVVPQTKRQILELQSLSHRHTKCEGVDFWTSAKITKKPVDIMVPPTAKKYIKLALDLIGAPHNVIIDNVQEVIDKQKNYRTKSDNDDDFFKEYHTFDEIITFTNGLLNTYSDILSEEEIGSSYEGRPMKVIKISTGGTKKNVIWWQSGIHAREWISPATLMYITKQLLEDFTKGYNNIDDILEVCDIYVLFVTNPDGYQYTWDTERLWRKTRSPNEGSDCIGTDPNRNFPYMWGGDGASKNPCSETYRGSGPASEQEIKAVVDFLYKFENSTFQMFIDFHSYSQFILYPWGYSTEAEPLENEKEVNELAGKIASAIKSVSGTSYEYGNSADMLYAAAGTSDDYAASVGARFPYTIELPDKGKYGFLLPKEDIIPTGEETYSGILAAFDYLLTNAFINC